MILCVIVHQDLFHCVNFSFMRNFISSVITTRTSTSFVSNVISSSLLYLKFYLFKSPVIPECSLQSMSRTYGLIPPNPIFKTPLMLLTTYIIQTIVPGIYKNFSKYGISIHQFLELFHQWKIQFIKYLKFCVQYHHAE